jgi:hypothetical protein
MPCAGPLFTEYLKDLKQIRENNAIKNFKFIWIMKKKINPEHNPLFFLGSAYKLYLHLLGVQYLQNLP